MHRPNRERRNPDMARSPRRGTYPAGLRSSRALTQPGKQVVGPSVALRKSGTAGQAIVLAGPPILAQNVSARKERAVGGDLSGVGSHSSQLLRYPRRTVNLHRDVGVIRHQRRQRALRIQLLESLCITRIAERLDAG